jgi:uncharacterized protein (DUF1330 family)
LPASGSNTLDPPNERLIALTAYAIVLASPSAENAEGAKAYSAGVQPLLAAAGVKVAFRGPVSESVAGSVAPAIGMVLEFPDTSAAHAFFAQEAYQALVALRDQSFDQMEIHIVN